MYELLYAHACRAATFSWQVIVPLLPFQYLIGPFLYMYVRSFKEVITWHKAWLIDVMRMVILKGSSAWEIAYHFSIVTGFAIFFNGWAVINYKKTA